MRSDITLAGGPGQKRPVFKFPDIDSAIRVFLALSDENSRYSLLALFAVTTWHIGLSDGRKSRHQE
jgi:hypothetical protein